MIFIESRANIVFNVVPLKQSKEKEVAMSIGRLIKDARVARRWSQEHLAELIDVSPPYICKLEKDVNPPSDKLCLELAEVLYLDSDNLRRLALEKRQDIKLEDLFFKPKTKKEKEFIGVFRSLSKKGQDELINFVMDAIARGDFILKK